MRCECDAGSPESLYLCLGEVSSQSRRRFVEVGQLGREGTQRLRVQTFRLVLNYFPFKGLRVPAAMSYAFVILRLVSNCLSLEAVSSVEVA